MLIRIPDFIAFSRRTIQWYNILNFKDVSHLDLKLSRFWAFLPSNKGSGIKVSIFVVDGWQHCTKQVKIWPRMNNRVHGTIIILIHMLCKLRSHDLERRFLYFLWMVGNPAQYKSKYGMYDDRVHGAIIILIHMLCKLTSHVIIHG